MPTTKPILRKYETNVNLSLNPSIETGVDGWAQYSVGGGITSTGFQRVNNAAYAGTWHWRVIVTANVALPDSYVCQVEDGYWSAGHIPGIVAGKTYTASAMYQSSTPDFGYRICIRWYSGTGVFISQTLSPVNSPSYNLSTQYKQREVTDVAPPGATNCTVQHIIYSKTSGTTGTVDIDGAMINEGPVIGYGDGSLPNWVWTGTAHASSSRRIGYTIPRYLTKRGLVLIEPIVKLSNNQNRPGNDITDAFIGGQVDMDYTRAIKTTCRLQLTDPDILDPYSDRIALYMRLSYPDGSEETTQIGLFLVEPPKTTLRSAQAQLEYEGFDMTYNLAQRIPGKTVEYGGGLNITQKVRDRLDGLGFPRHEIPSDTEVFPSRGWRRHPSTDMNELKILNDMCASAGYYTLWATHTGKIKTLAYSSRKIRSSVKTYVGGEDGVVIEPFTSNLTTKPYNRVVVTREVDGVTYRGEARNDDPADPHSIPNIGEKTWYEEDDKVVSSTAAQRLAEELLDEKGSVSTEAQLLTLPEPWHNVHEVYTLDLRKVTGRKWRDSVGRFWCTGFSFGLTAQEAIMTHKLKRLNLELDDLL